MNYSLLFLTMDCIYHAADNRQRILRANFSTRSYLENMILYISEVKHACMFGDVNTPVDQWVFVKEPYTLTCVLCFKPYHFMYKPYKPYCVFLMLNTII